jgi:hypothetical protein
MADGPAAPSRTVVDVSNDNRLYTIMAECLKTVAF